MPVRVGVLGFGAIGRSVVDSLLGHKEEFNLIGFSDVEQVDDSPIPQLPVEEMIQSSDIVVEVASHAAVRHERFRAKKPLPFVLHCRKAQ